MVGPQLPGVAPGDRGNYGGFMRPGEGDAMAAYVQVGRGERLAVVGGLGLSLACLSRTEGLLEGES
jgi:hypothetical protein